MARGTGDATLEDAANLRMEVIKTQGEDIENMWKIALTHVQKYFD